MDKKLLHEISLWFVIFGAIYLGLYSFLGSDYDIINFIFRENVLVYGDFDILVFLGQLLGTLIGAAGVYLLYIHLSDKKVEAKK